MIKKTIYETALQNVEGKTKRKQVMKKNENEKIMMLQYRIKRYHAMGNGAMCQALNGQLQKLLSMQATM